jgi:hypothetical protein
MLDATICSETIFESRDVRAENKLCAIDDASNSGVDLRLHLSVLRFQVEERYQRLGLREWYPLNGVRRLL